MVEYQKYINALRKCAKEHENDKTSTGHIIVSDLCKDTANLLEELEQESKWIPVSERLPEEETDVLICNKQGEIEISQGSRSTEVDAFIWYTSGWRFGEVIAWQPLPEPYKAESEE